MSEQPTISQIFFSVFFCEFFPLFLYTTCSDALSLSSGATFCHMRLTACRCRHFNDHYIIETKRRRNRDETSTCISDIAQTHSFQNLTRATEVVDATSSQIRWRTKKNDFFSFFASCVLVRVCVNCTMYTPTNNPWIMFIFLSPPHHPSTHSLLLRLRIRDSCAISPIFIFIIETSPPPLSLSFFRFSSSSSSSSSRAYIENCFSQFWFWRHNGVNTMCHHHHHYHHITKETFVDKANPTHTHTSNAYVDSHSNQNPMRLFKAEAEKGRRKKNEEIIFIPHPLTIACHCSVCVPCSRQVCLDTFLIDFGMEQSAWRRKRCERRQFSSFLFVRFSILW